MIVSAFISLDAYVLAIELFECLRIHPRFLVQPFFPLASAYLEIACSISAIIFCAKKHPWNHFIVFRTRGGIDCNHIGDWWLVPLLGFNGNYCPVQLGGATSNQYANNKESKVYCEEQTTLPVFIDQEGVISHLHFYF